MPPRWTQLVLLLMTLLLTAPSWAVTSLANAAIWHAPSPSDPPEGIKTGIELPPTEADWQAIQLPHAIRVQRAGSLAVHWLRFRWDMRDPPATGSALYLSRLSIGGDFFLNGMQIASIRASDLHTQMRWRRPHLLPLPTSAIRAGPNELLVRISSRDATSNVPEILLGAESDLRPEFDRRYLAEYSSAQFSGAAAAIVALFMLGIWWFRQEERLYLLFALTCGFWALRMHTYLAEAVAWAWWWPWRALYAAWTGCFALSVAAFFLSYIGALVARWRVLLLTYALAGPLLLLVSQGALESWVSLYWTGGLFALELYVLVSFARWLRHHPSLEALSLAGGAIVMFLLAANDFAVRSGWMHYSNAYAIHFGAPIVMLAMGGLLAKRFVGATRLVESSNQELKRRLEEQELQLSQQHDALRAVEQSQARAAERQRIMQDMHDGLGSQLLTSLAAVERGAMDSRAMAQTLRDAMDDMRLAIDTLSPEEDGFLAAVGNLRYRLEPRLRAAGIDLKMACQNLPTPLAVPGSAALQILRVLQESIANVLKHASASRVEVSLAITADPAVLMLRVSDNGRGMPATPGGRGRGLTGMRRRAERIGATLDLRSGPQGTTIELAWPLSAPSADSGR